MSFRQDVITRTNTPGAFGVLRAVGLLAEFPRLHLIVSTRETLARWRRSSSIEQ
jgi:hypothetical protein